MLPMEAEDAATSGDAGRGNPQLRPILMTVFLAFMGQMLLNPIIAHSEPDPATKEALQYRTALFAGFQALRERPLSTQTAELVCSEIKGRVMSAPLLASITQTCSPSAKSTFTSSRDT